MEIRLTAYMMLTALLDGNRVSIWDASHGKDYKCPLCDQSVVPHMGRMVVHHFKHKRRTSCPAGAGETRAHLEAKEVLVTALSKRGLRADVEVEVKGIRGTPYLLTLDNK